MKIKTCLKPQASYRLRKRLKIYVVPCKSFRPFFKKSPGSVDEINRPTIKQWSLQQNLPKTVVVGLLEFFGHLEKSHVR